MSARTKPILSPLPISDVLPSLTSALRTVGAAVVIAPPGAGKTTRVPGAILDDELMRIGETAGDIVVLEPRRLAARMAAARVAEERGCDLGQEVGYEVRFERRVSRATRIRFITEGILTRRMLDDPLLEGTAVVVLDEVHERHLAGDLALALLQQLRRGRRPDLKIVAMSATLDPGPVADFLSAPVIVSEGRMYPVAIEHATAVDDRPLAKQVASAVRRVAQEGLDGHVLVFLPGTAEIRRTAEELRELAERYVFDVWPLHGDLSMEEQARAVGRSTRSKVILATNVAETSITIEGVVAVIDSGLARIARHSPWSGLSNLLVEPISRASAIQRVGRAGRTRPGRAIRLYTKHDFDTRRERDVPEVARDDLAEAALELHAQGFARLADFPWFEAPPSASAQSAEVLLERLGAIDGDGRVTALGKRMLQFPVHPRQARMICAAEDAGVGGEGAMCAALLSARELRHERRDSRRQARIAADSDLLEDLAAMEDARDRQLKPHVLRELGLDIGTVMGVERTAQQLERLVRNRSKPPSNAAGVDEALLVATLAGYPDRLGRKRPGSAEVVFVGGGSGALAPGSVVIGAELLVALDASEVSRGKTTIRRASRVEPIWLLDLFPERVTERDEVVWNRKAERVDRVQRTLFDELVIDEQIAPGGARNDPRASALLAQEAVALGIERFVEADRLREWRARITFAAAHIPALVAPTDDALRTLLATACEGMISFAELRNASLLDLLDASLSGQRSLIDEVAPRTVALSRRRVAIHYEADRPPWIASRMQDFFGLARGPAVARGRVPLVLHLLAPNQRPVQVTQDLPGFWQRHYPELRRQLMRRYPKHAWPENPLDLVQD